MLCFDASRLARNGRDWHHLLELCGLVEARVIDMDGVYDPCRPNDRLLLGMKGSISESELGILRARMLDAVRSKARRGELRISVPLGYTWHREVGLGFDPDLRVQEAVRLIFARFREAGSARQVLLQPAAEGVHFPRPSDGKRMVALDWRAIRYRNVISVLKNPFYAGAYAYGKSEKRTAVVDGRARRSYGHGKPFQQWEVLLKGHHDGYIDWAEFERNQALLAANAYGKLGGAKSGRGGRALLAGLLSCARCGRRLMVSYSGRPPGQTVYRCDRPHLMLGLPRCLTFGGSRAMAARWSDEDIAASLNRMGTRTGQGKTWTAHRVGSLRRVHGIHAYRSAEKDGGWLTMSEAAAALGVTHHRIRRLIKGGVLAAEQVVPGAPYQIRAGDLRDERVTAAIGRKARPCRADPDDQLAMFTDT